jgi:hypothetical protein
MPAHSLFGSKIGSARKKPTHLNKKEIRTGRTNGQISFVTQSKKSCHHANQTSIIGKRIWLTVLKLWSKYCKSIWT